ncbi:methylated-DNA--[protein]-cysteine S-methyltransferase [Streptomyces sp. NPDC059651]|uniref:methylated-DNA--[protein]-cysteine S-methyltransferase n=1 Tax=Streptomyces sp. NPDC059651 TaxID=3346897 RepID=UPI0036C11E42
MTACTTISSPVGDLFLVGEESGTAPGGTALTSLSMPGQRRVPVVRGGGRRDPGAFAVIAAQIGAYFDGELDCFDIEFTVSGSDFQQRVWAAVEEIPYGTSTTYGALAARLGMARADVRALGGAIGANPLLLVRPCHRVVGADGSMKGYAGGLEAKRHLLTLEGVLQPMLG